MRPSDMVDRDHERPPVTVILHNHNVYVGWLTAFTNNRTHQVKMDLTNGERCIVPRYAVREVRGVSPVKEKRS